MANYLERREQQRRDWDKYSNTPANARIKFIAVILMVSAGITMIAVFLLTAFRYEGTAPKTILVLRIIAGVFAAIGVVIYMLLSYRVNSAAIADRNKPEIR